MELSNKRCIQILKLLMKSKDKMTGDNLAISIGVSSRTIRNDMKELNRELKKYGAEVISEIGQGYYLKVTQKEKFAGWVSILDKKGYDLDGKENIEAAHISEALQYRNLDRSVKKC